MSAEQREAGKQAVMQLLQERDPGAQGEFPVTSADQHSREIQPFMIRRSQKSAQIEFSWEELEDLAQNGGVKSRINERLKSALDSLA